MISSALLNIVAESIVTLLPIRQVGWFERIVERGVLASARAGVAERPAAGGEDDALDFARAARSASPGRPPSARNRPAGSCTSRRFRLGHEQRAGDDERFLVRQRERLARLRPRRTPRANPPRRRSRPARCRRRRAGPSRPIPSARRTPARRASERRDDASASRASPIATAAGRCSLVCSRSLSI